MCNKENSDGQFIFRSNSAGDWRQQRNRRCDRPRVRSAGRAHWASLPRRGCSRHRQCADWACEVGPLGIIVNAVAPGPVQTGYITPEMERQLLPTIPLRRLGTPEDIADAVVLLVSEGTRWMTGQVIQVAGGHAL